VTRPGRRRSSAGGRWLLVAFAVVACLTRSLGSAPGTAALSLLANNDAYSVRHDRVLSVPAPGVLGNDVIVLGATAVRDSQPTHGTLALQSNGAFTYTPAAGYSGTDSFRYHAQDLLSSNQATVTITVTNATPVAHDDAYTATTGVTLAVPAPGLLANDTDGDGDALTVQLVDGSGNGSLDVNADGSFSFTSGGSFSGDRTFTYRITDGLAWSAVATVTIIVSPAATPTPRPTPTPTPQPTPAPPTPTPASSLPIPTLPVPTLSLPTASAPSLPAPSLPVATLPIPTPTPSSGPAASPTPTSSSPDAAATIGPVGAPGGGSSGGTGTGSDRAGSESGFTVADSFGSFDALDPIAFGGFEWAVPGLALSVPGLLLILAITAQGGVGLFSMPFVRRWLGNFGVRRRRARQARSG
jgi:VCBS repeat-containing protein